MFFYLQSSKSFQVFWEVTWRQTLISLKQFSHQKELALLISVCNYSSYFLEFIIPFWSHSSHLFNHTRNKGVIWNPETQYWQKQSDCELVKRARREEKVSSVSGQTEQTSFCSWLLRDDGFGCQMTGIDTVWDFSTICNNDLFSEATNCQVITFLGWKWTIFWHR